MNRVRQIRGGLVIRTALAAVTVAALPAVAQFTQAMKINNFSVSHPFPPPNFQQMQYRLTGREGLPQSNQLVRLTGMKLETFRVNGDVEMIVEAPECWFDGKARTAESAGKLVLQSGDGRLRVEGDGFHCEMTGKILIISNRVQAVIRRPNTNANAAPLVITSRWLEFDAEKRRAVFHDDVRGDDPEFTFNCGQLAVSAAPTNQNAFDLIEASEAFNVVGKTGVRRGAADRGIYRQAEESVELIGNATWNVDGKSGRADRVRGLRGDGSVLAEGNVAMKLPRTELGAATGLLSATNNAASNNALLDVFADRFLLRSNFVNGTGGVRIVDAANRVSFSADTLEARQAANATDDETAVATGNVVVEREGAKIRSERADYSKRFGAVVFTGHPNWWQEQLEGSAERVTFKTVTREIEAENDVAVKIRIPGKSSGSPLAFFPQGPTNATAQVVEIASQRLTVKELERKALFTDGVAAHQTPRTGSEARLRSETLEVVFTPQGNRLEAITANQNVIYEQGTVGVTNGLALYRKLTCRTLTTKADPQSGEPAELIVDGGVRLVQPGTEGRADRAVYDRSTDILRLIGNPVIDLPQATYTSGREIQYDNGRRTVIGSDYKIIVKPEALKQAAESQTLPGQ